MNKEISTYNLNIQSSNFKYRVEAFKKKTNSINFFFNSIAP